MRDLLDLFLLRYEIPPWLTEASDYPRVLAIPLTHLHTLRDRPGHMTYAVMGDSLSRGIGTRPHVVHASQGHKVGLHTPTILGGNSHLN